MSGICGFVTENGDRKQQENHILSMIDSLRFPEQPVGSGLCLGSVSLGAQGFSGRESGVARLSQNEQLVALAFHGNLYNLKELFNLKGNNTDLLKKLLNLFLKEGVPLLKKLRGEFVLAVWDGRDESLYLATDRFRVHQLFYYQDQEKFVFSSRMKGILACPFRVKRSINPEAIIHISGSSIIPTPDTIFNEVKKVPSSHLLTYRKGEVKLEPYWEISFLNPSKENESSLANRFRVIFEEAVTLSLEADGKRERTGAFLSGGVDSSTVTGVLAQLLGHPVKSFSIGFDEQPFNEINYARIAAQAFNSDHHEYFVSPKDTYDAIPILLESFDEPFANASAVPAYYCAKMAKEHEVDFLYAGDGGDELFAGNERYGGQHLFEYYNQIPPWLREPILRPIVTTLADSLGWTIFLKGKKYIQRASIPYHERISSYAFFNTVPMGHFFEDDFLERAGRQFSLNSMTNRYYFEAPALTNLDRHLYIDWKLTLSDNDIIKVTRATEAAGVTVRFPFLDHRLVEFSVTVPANIKMRGTRLRTFQKRAYANLLPLEIRKKKKHGFGLPIPVWLRTDKKLNEMMMDLVLSPRSVQRGYFRGKALAELVEHHKTDATSFYGTTLWNLMVLELWHRHYQDKIQ